MEYIQIITLFVSLTTLVAVIHLILNLPSRVASKRNGLQPILLDTSVLIDGRIVMLAKSGFIARTLVVPRSVVGELQLLADKGDHDKRERARFGLDVISDLQTMPEVNLEILQDGDRAEEGVDSRLLSLAKKSGAAICTIDYNLAKVATVENVSILNINELAQGLRMAHLPGEFIELELVQKGQDAHQAVGYLSDGTMVVVDRADKLINKTVRIEIIRSLQTAAGRMMFAKLANQPIDGRSPASRSQNKASSSANRQSKPKARKPQNRRPNDPESSLIDLIDKS